MTINTPKGVEFWIGGEFGFPSKADKDTSIVVHRMPLKPAIKPLLDIPVMVRVRQNANDLTTAERDRFLAALGALNNKGLGTFTQFRDMHTSASSPQAHGAPGFLPWHRAYLLDLERELQLIDPSVALPYWRFDQPAPNLFSPDFIGTSTPGGVVQFNLTNPLQYWTTDGVLGVLRRPSFNTTTGNATGRNEAQTLAIGAPNALYTSFSSMEGNPHGSAHTSFSGSISSVPSAARDPLFFLLHANVDRLWAKWQWLNDRFDPTNASSYAFAGSAGTPGASPPGHNLLDSMWPWNGVTTAPRPPVAPGGSFAASSAFKAPGPQPTVRDMLDMGRINPKTNLGLDYDDVPFA